MGTIISRFEDKGSEDHCDENASVTPELSRQHYAEHVENRFIKSESFITSALWLRWRSTA